MELVIESSLLADFEFKRFHFLESYRNIDIVVMSENVCFNLELTHL
jgi:hypothetical protein